ncbi:MAG: biopolymer transporter ExbD [Bacteroidetes bacterium GWC2_33_15]|nr:MAG: biopolymer transporter ExbD [Bacteroidetes bacterium GWA2_33_15]OFX50048.1 MAG: biopolymer transporter ExbD [Bacteroidetes bacterium GWC2_33_15]OFX65201.1 MAG: biopolymer transporter ExbD [Bacteroidetes bacterium GWB2_32_14]OFX70427.1 MAG: biopolymer transporter ExbD [Bacteroidetes bacterium GWD2_33_33]HAN19704.1 biopolymer transporter ExbD [Bacteroidales bacterium]
MALKRRNKVSAAFSMASMTDLVFLLLIFFMITSTLVAPNALKLLLPRSPHQTSASAITTISIDASLDYYIETTPVALEDIEGILKNRFAGENISEPTISVHADKSVPIENVVKIMNIAKDNKWKLILATTAN